MRRGDLITGDPLALAGDRQSAWRVVRAPGDGAVPAWRQPLGAHDAYAQGSRVRHADHTWESTIDANVWEPGVYGWKRVD